LLHVVAAAAAAAFLAAAPAASPFSLTTSPPAVHVAAGQSANIIVTDTGSQPLAVSARLASVGKITGKCTATAGQPHGVTLSAASFSLKPGGSGVEHVTVSPGAPDQDLAVIFASAPAQSGTARVSREVGSQVAIGSALVCGAPPAGGGLLEPLGIALAALGAVCAALLVSVRRIRRRRTTA
jgi:hypothetical protein